MTEHDLASKNTSESLPRARTHAQAHEPHAWAGPLQRQPQLRGGKAGCRNFPGLYIYARQMIEGVVSIGKIRLPPAARNPPVLTLAWAPGPPARAGLASR
jgi:hypothetical protein